ncbi:hypothetical protein GU243_11465 [Pseudarthrobacter psychrotolerans]|uniref:Uncharacterized protein n=1 Tax=Pseudarthrobacter psychrotolerans TaxID=2697569 RepID=A0A6P1NNB0_9MICC|nr:hypothetical protein [Pseudarthrobacter psychrotolerans]QHK20247.1 hypothetical protein GU243_11465 [Pseudarthrobacter psychrotolerans]
MPNDTTQPDNTEPETAESDRTGTKDPTGIEGANPALDDTGSPKADEVGEAAEPPEDLQNLDLTPEGLSDEPAQQEDPDSVAKPENS